MKTARPSRMTPFWASAGLSFPLPAWCFCFSSSPLRVAGGTHFHWTPGYGVWVWKRDAQRGGNRVLVLRKHTAGVITQSGLLHGMEHPRPGGLTNRNILLTVPAGSWEPTTEVAAGLVSLEASLLGLQMAAYSLSPQHVLPGVCLLPGRLLSEGQQSRWTRGRPEGFL